MPSADTRKPIGQVLDSLGVTARLKDGDLIAGAVILLKVVEDDGRVRLTSLWSDGMSWIERVGMLHTAQMTEDESAEVEDPDA